MGKFREKFTKVDFTKADELQKSAARFTLFKDAAETTGKVVTEETVKNENLNQNVPTVLMMHGWTANDSHESSPWYASLKDELFKSGPQNVFYLDWSVAGNRSYSVSCANTRPMGKIIAEFFIASGVPLNKIHLVGHSLGCQLASFVGKFVHELTGSKIGRITALDPAGPCWEDKEMVSDERLCPSDADFVDVIHTDIIFSGYTAPCGHVDFYPNGGKDQPGCAPGDTGGKCSHRRCRLLFIESVGTKTKGLETEYTEVNYDAVFKLKESAKEAIFGYHTDTASRGVFTFETNSSTPFLK